MEHKSRTQQIAEEQLLLELRTACEKEAQYSHPGVTWAEKCTDKTVDSLFQKLLPKIDYYLSGNLTPEFRIYVRRYARKSWRLNRLEHLKPSRTVCLDECSGRYHTCEPILAESLQQDLEHSAMESVIEILVRRGTRREIATAFLLNTCYNVPYAVIENLLNKQFHVSMKPAAIRKAVQRLREDNMEVLREWAQEGQMG